MVSCEHILEKTTPPAMTTHQTFPHTGANNPAETFGTPQRFSLTVRLLGGEWIVESAIGACLGSAPHREQAIALARNAAAEQDASCISVLSADGDVEQTVCI